MLAQVIVNGVNMSPAFAISMLISVGIPLLVGVITKLHASQALKGALNALLSAATAALTDYLAHPKHVAWYILVLNIGINFAISEASYYGIWKPTGIANGLQNATANFGIGSSSPNPGPVNMGSPLTTYPGSPIPVSNVTPTSPPLVVPPPDEPVDDTTLPEGGSSSKT